METITYNEFCISEIVAHFFTKNSDYLQTIYNKHVAHRNKHFRL